MSRIVILSLLSFFLSGLSWADTLTMDLSEGSWTFALDPTDRGESTNWHKPSENWDGKKTHPRGGWDEITLPHDYLSDPRYAYTGVAWYRHSFAIPKGVDSSLIWRLQFETVFQRCRIWINGEYVGAHEGGYTPFEFKVGKFLIPGRQNFLVVAVDNRVKFRALPGARSGSTANAGQYPWLNYGGILGKVSLVAHEALWVKSQKISTIPGQDTWELKVEAEICNDTDQQRKGKVFVRISPSGEMLSGDYTAAPNSSTHISLAKKVPLNSVKAWDIQSPTLYSSEVTLDSKAPALISHFGFRSLKIADAKFLLNGKAIRWAGANRARGHPVHGGIDPDALVEQDMQLMKDAGLIFSRIQHTAPGRNLLDWADRNGMLLVLEVGMWGYISPDQASEELRSRFKAEMQELILLAQNHPSVVGWSIGNEYESWTEEGVQWTKDMVAFVKSLDDTRPVTFAALGRELRLLKEGKAPEKHSFDYVDYISANYYLKPADLEEFLDPVHKRWPDKPVAITEFGLRADKVDSEQKRIEHFDTLLGKIRQRPWVCGISFWSFNDYASRYPGTGIDGYRRWGLVDEYRKPRALYEHVAPLLKRGLDAPAE